MNVVLTDRYFCVSHCHFFVCHVNVVLNDGDPIFYKKCDPQPFSVLTVFIDLFPVPENVYVYVSYQEEVQIPTLKCCRVTFGAIRNSTV